MRSTNKGAELRLKALYIFLYDFPGARAAPVGFHHTEPHAHYGILAPSAAASNGSRSPRSKRATSNGEKYEAQNRRHFL